MDKKTINAKFKELAELKLMSKELDKEIAKIEDELKNYMEANRIEELFGDEHKATWKLTASTKFDKNGIIQRVAELTEGDAKAIKAQYTLSNPSMRFTFA